MIRIGSELTVVGAFASWTVPGGDHQLSLPRSHQQLLNPHVSSSTLSHSVVFIPTCKGARACRQWHVLLPSNHLEFSLSCPDMKLLEKVFIVISRYEDTHSMDQSLWGEVVAASPCTNPRIQRSRWTWPERAEKVESFSCTLLPSPIRWIWS